MKGYKSWKNPNNQLHVTELHFTADPEKDNPEWIARSKIGISKDKWEREVNLKWTRTTGKAVYGEEFNRQIHVNGEDILPVVGEPILRGWDFGLSQTVVFSQVQDSRLIVLAELVSNDYYPSDYHVGTTRTCPVVKEFSAAHFPHFRFVDIIDPAAKNPSEKDAQSSVDVMKKEGFRNLKYGPTAFEERRNSVITLLTTMHRGRPRLLVNPGCVRIIDGFVGAYHYPQKAGVRTRYRTDRPIKSHPYSDLHDGIQYQACYMLKQGVQQRQRAALARIGDIPQMLYDFETD